MPLLPESDNKMPATAEHARQLPWVAPRTPNALPSPSVALNHIRFVAARARCGPREDFQQACAVLSIDKSIATEAHARVLLRGLQQAFGGTPRLYAPGVEAVSFDEAWLLQLLAAHDRRDDHSFEFLIRSRLPRSSQRNVAFLIRAIANEFCQN